MNIPVLLEPTAAGFRASTGAPLNLTAEAPTAEDALKTVRLQLSVMFARGCHIVDVGDAVSKFTASWAKLANDPQREEFLQAMAEYRAERDAEPVPAADAQPERSGVPQ